MKILLDECVTKRLKPFLAKYEVFTVREMGWGGIKNGKLLSLCVENGFELLLTIDKNMIHQQNMKQYKLTLAVLNCTSSKIEELQQFIPSLEKQLKQLRPFAAYLIER